MAQRQQSRTVRTQHPVRDWEDALITGSGRIGALVHATAHRTQLTLGHERLFLPTLESLPAPRTAPVLDELRALLRAGRSRETAARIVEVAAAEHPGYAQTRWIDPLVGAGVLSFTPRLPGPGPVLRSCDLDSGLVTEDLPCGSRHRVFASRAEDAVLAELTSPEGLNGRLCLTGLEEPAPVPLLVETETNPNLLSLRTGFPERRPGTLPGYTVSCAVAAEGGTVSRSGTEGLELAGVERLLLVARVALEEPATAVAVTVPGDCGAAAPGAPPQAVPGAGTFDERLDRHRALHGDLMSRFRVRLGGGTEADGHRSADGSATAEALLAQGPTPELCTRLVDAARYAIISSCGDRPPTLQGIWSGTYDPPWRSGYTFDGNLPSALAALHATGTPELMTGLFDLLDAMSDDLTENARRLYGCGGILVPAHASTSGRHNHFGPEWCLTCWTSGAAWLARLYWDHFSYTRDLAFLRDRGLPFLVAAARFHEDFLLTDEGFLPSYSPENTPADADGQASVNATLDVAAVRDLTRNLVRTHRILGIPGARRWVRLAARLPGYRISPDGELAEWAGPTDSSGGISQLEQHGHRHASHLFPLWYEPDPAFACPELGGAAARAVGARLAWWRGQESDEMAFGLVQLGLAAARLGMAQEAHETLALLATRYWRPTLVPTHNRGALFNVDIGGGFPAVVTAMLAGSTEGRVDLLPALPEEWASGRVEGLRARGGVFIDRLEWEKGTGTAELRSVVPRELYVGLPDGSRPRVRTGPDHAARIHFRPR